MNPSAGVLVMLARHAGVLGCLGKLSLESFESLGEIPEGNALEVFDGLVVLWILDSSWAKGHAAKVLAARRAFEADFSDRDATTGVYLEVNRATAREIGEVERFASNEPTTSRLNCVVELDQGSDVPGGRLSICPDRRTGGHVVAAPIFGRG